MSPSTTARACVGSAQRQRGVEEPGEGPAEAEAGDARCGVADRVGVELVTPSAACGDDSPVIRMENCGRARCTGHLAAASRGSSRGSASDSTGSNTAKAVVSALTPFLLTAISMRRATLPIDGRGHAIEVRASAV